MSLAGNLREVSLVDLLQFLKLTGRTGTIHLARDAEQASIGLYEGEIVRASTPSSKRLGAHLIARGVLTDEQLEHALGEQRRTPDKPLGVLLVQDNAVSRHHVLRAIEQQVEEAIYELLTWERGSFHFQHGDLKPIDDLFLLPSEVTALNLSTQQILLEAARQLDERGRPSGQAGRRAASTDLERLSDPPTSAPPRRRARPGCSGVRGRPQVARALPPAKPTLAATAGATSPRDPDHTLFLLSADVILDGRLRALLQREGRQLSRADPFHVPTPSASDCPPAVLLDIRQRPELIGHVRTLRRMRPNGPVIAIVTGSEPLAEVYAAGATAIVDADEDAIVACVRSQEAHYRRVLGEGPYADGLSAGFAQLRLLIREARAGALSATVSLELLNLVAECGERAVFFLVRPRELVQFGAFGHTEQGERLAERTRGLRLPITDGCTLWRSAEDQQARGMPCEGASLPEALMERIGWPRSRRCAVLPVPGSNGIIAVVYLDNGTKNWPIDAVEFLELAVAQLGLAFENELLRRGRYQIA